MNLDWLLVALLLLPFVARLFGGGAKPQPPDDGTAAPEEGEAWSMGWSEWPAEEASGGLDAERPAEPPEPIPSQVAPAASSPPEPRPLGATNVPRRTSGRDAAADSETVPAPLPTPLPEPTAVDREAEHERFHRAVAAVRSRPGPARTRLVTGDRAALRRAILLREVLGPPRALQPLEGGRA